jgi:ATP-dependent DNA helicase RecQ
MKGKNAGEFDARLVGASARFITEKWRPQPTPTWVTFVSSHLHPNLVPQFAQQLASALGLDCLDAVKKVRENQPQKQMENTHHRCRNLDGVFDVLPSIPEGPVLLIDDAVDSGWTFAVIAALLKRAGSGPVFPFAILSTSGRG